LRRYVDRLVDDFVQLRVDKIKKDILAAVGSTFDIDPSMRADMGTVKKLAGQVCGSRWVRGEDG
jgi:hypothetical protein